MNVIITGASRGIGKAIALQLAKLNCNVIACGRNEESLQELYRELTVYNPDGKHKVLRVDVSIKEECKKFAQDCQAHFSEIDVLVNNAGQYEGGEISNEKDGQLEHMLQTNLLSAYYITRAFLPAMMERKQGCIINIGSIAGLQAYANGGSYSISKFAMVGFSKNLREELKPYGIKVCTINPGATMSDSWKGSGIQAERILEAEDIAKLVGFITTLSPQAVVEDITMRPLLGDL